MIEVEHETTAERAHLVFFGFLGKPPEIHFSNSENSSCQRGSSACRRSPATGNEAMRGGTCLNPNPLSFCLESKHEILVTSKFLENNMEKNNLFH